MIDHGFGVTLEPLDPLNNVIMSRWRNDPRIMQWCRQVDPITRKQQKAWFKRQVKDPTMRMYSIYDKSPRNIVGVCGLTSIDYVNSRAEFSLYIGPEHQGQNRGRKALSTLLSHAFKTLNLNLIWGESFEDNPAMKTFDKLGFTREGIRRDFYYKNGRYINAHLFSIKASEWNP